MKSSNPSDAKSPKAKGPIRTGAVVPALILSVLLVLYFILFFDSHLRRGIEWAATYAHGAEVNVGHLKTSFLQARLDIGDIQVTDTQRPTHNKVQIGKIGGDLLWDALLRGKAVVNFAGITDIEVGTPRKSPGFVLPPPAEQGFITKAKTQVSRAILAEAGELLEGLDPAKKIKDLGNLKSLAFIEQLKKSLDQKQADWKKSLDSIPGQKEFQDLQGKIAALQAGGTSNPQEIAARVQQAQSLIQESEAKLNAVKAQGDAIQKDVQGFGSSVGQIDEVVKQDRLDLEKQLKLPSLDAKNMAQQLFGNTILDKVAQVQRYIAMGRQYMPAKKKEDPEVDLPKRALGQTYEFGRPNSYPLFWLKRAEISSTGLHSAFGGDLKGTLTDATTNPPQIGKPAVLTLQGDFPKQELRGLEAEITVDHTKDEAEEKIRARVGSYPVPRKPISDSEDVKFAFAKAVGSAGLEASLKGDRIHFGIDNTFRKIDYEIAAKSKLLQETLQGVAKEIPVVTVNASVDGTWNDFGIKIDSNLASALGSGLQRQLQAKLEEARKKIDAMIHAKVDAARAQVMSQYNAERAKLMAQVDERRKQAEAVRDQAMAKLNQIKSQAEGLKQKATEQLKDKIKLKNPFGR